MQNLWHDFNMIHEILSCEHLPNMIFVGKNRNQIVLLAKCIFLNFDIISFWKKSAQTWLSKKTVTSEILKKNNCLFVITVSRIKKVKTNFNEQMVNLFPNQDDDNIFEKTEEYSLIIALIFFFLSFFDYISSKVPISCSFWCLFFILISVINGFITRIIYKRSWNRMIGQFTIKSNPVLFVMDLIVCIIGLIVISYVLFFSDLRLIIELI